MNSSIKNIIKFNTKMKLLLFYLSFIPLILHAQASPDLFIQDITWTPENPSIGDIVTFSTTIANQGNVSSIGGYTHFYLDGSTSPLTYKSFTAIEAGSTASVSFTWNAQAGTHTFKGIVDVANKISEVDETNNEKTITYSSTALSDLIVQDITWSPENPSIGETVTFTATIKNQGSGSSVANRVYFYLDGSTSQLTYKNFGGLSSGATTDVIFTWNALANDHTFRAVVDRDNSIPESDETNNEQTITFSATELPDLKVQDITWSPENPSIGDTITFTATIKNQGNGSSVGNRAYFYLDGSASQLIYKNFGGLSSGATTDVIFTWNALASDHTFRAVVDRDNSIPESDETNNEQTITFSATELPDLKVQDITWSPENPSIGDTITFTATIKNQGNGSSVGNRAYFYLDGSASQLIYKNFGGLSSGATTDVIFTWNAIAGDHTFRAVVDKTNTIPESDETNNEKTITFSSTALSDLVVENIKWTPESSSIGDSITFTTTIKNQGNGSSSNGNVHFYFDDSTTQYTYKPINGITAGSLTTVSFIWKAQPDFHTLTAIIDKNNNIDESNELNNEKNVTFSIVSLPDLIVQNITWTPGSCTIGDTVTFTATIKNQGTQKSENSIINFYFDGSNTVYTHQILPEISAGSIKKVTFTWIAQKGSHTIKAVVDKDNAVTEINEKNNEKTITFSVVSLSDLIVQDITLTPQKPSVGDTVTFSATIKNQGQGKSGKGNVYFYLDRSTTYFHTVPIKEIYPGEIAKVPCIWNAQFGSHTIRVAISEGVLKTESDQTNNEKIYTISPMDTTAPQISLNTQINEYNKNNILEEGEKLEITYGANDDASGVNYIKLFVNDKFIDQQNSAGTFTKITNSLPMGECTIRVEAVDKASNSAEENMQITVERTGPSVYFGSTRTYIEEGDNAIITLSAVNPIGNPPMNVQLILTPSSGVSVYGTDWITGGSGQYIGEFPLNPDDGVRSISIHVHVNQPGTNYVDSKIIYEVEGERVIRLERLDLIPPPPPPKPNPGFEGIVMLIGLCLATILIKRKMV